MAVRVAQLVQNLPAVTRKWRRPKHPFNLETRPYQLQPFLIAPVLPGDTLKKGMMQSRVITDPINNAIIGWHKEYYFFYVKLTDLNIRDQIPAMFVGGGESLGTAVANVKTYHAGGTVDFAAECLQRCVQEFFRDEGEAWDVATLDSLPIGQAFGRQDNAFDSMIIDDAAPETAETGDEMAEMYGEDYVKWQAMAKARLTDLTFEEYLERAYGVQLNQTKNDLHRPELLRFLKRWSYPSNTVDPATGTPSSAVAWSVAEQISKSRFFREPGFVFGITTTRPKVYMKNQTGSVAQLLDKGERWLPSIVLADEKHASVINVPTGTGPIPGITDDGGYWVDLVDLFHYGEQFVNFATSTASRNMVTLPGVDGSKKYPTAADIDALFKAAANNKVREDGIVDLRFLSRVEDSTR